MAHNFMDEFDYFLLVRPTTIMTNAAVIVGVMSS